MVNWEKEIRSLKGKAIHQYGLIQEGDRVLVGVSGGKDSTANITATVKWTSSNASVATINASGLATAVAVGTSTITATQGAINGSKTLTVTAATLVSIAVTPPNGSIAKGLTLQHTATGTYTDSSTANITATVTWTSSAASVATVNTAVSLLESRWGHQV